MFRFFRKINWMAGGHLGVVMAPGQAPKSQNYCMSPCMDSLSRHSCTYMHATEFTFSKEVSRCQVARRHVVAAPEESVGSLKCILFELGDQLQLR